jgi:hypothetical protein
LKDELKGIEANAGKSLKIKPREISGIRPGFAVNLAKFFLNEKPQNTE